MRFFFHDHNLTQRELVDSFIEYSMSIGLLIGCGCINEM
jgi:hypothetical protein